MSNEQAVSTAEEVVKEKPKKSASDVANIVINVILVIAIIVAAVCTYVSFVSTSGNGVPNLLGYEIFSVQTDSMYPTLKSGDLVIDKVVKDTSELRVGDIITYWTVINGERVLNTHRINQIFTGGSYLIFETKGDKNDLADSLTVHESEVVGVYHSHISGLGKAFDYLQTSTGFLVVIVVPVALFFLFHLIQFFRVLFEYQNIKSRLKYQEELDAKGIIVKDEEPEAEPAPAAVDKAQIEAELREQIKAEMMAQMLAELKKQNTEAAAPAAEEAAPTEESAAEEAVADEAAVEEPAAEEAPAEESAEEPAPQEETAEESAPQEETADESASQEEPDEEPTPTEESETEVKEEEPAAEAEEK